MADHNDKTQSSRPKSFMNLIKTSSIPVLVDFYADWCGPCRMVSPAIARLAGELKGQVLTVKVNVDTNPQAAAAYEVSSIPTIMLFSGGRPIMTLPGAHPFERIKEEVLRRLPSA
jgi:thioredoxin 1